MVDSNLAFCAQFLSQSKCDGAAQENAARGVGRILIEVAFQILIGLLTAQNPCRSQKYAGAVQGMLPMAGAAC
jgi:hypothetical protein